MGATFLWNCSNASLPNHKSKSSIRTPTFVIGEWYDGYRDSVPRMLEKLEAPVKGVMGPWAKIKYWEDIIHTAQDNSPAKASVTGKTRYAIELENRIVTLEGDLSFTSDRENFYYIYTRRALKNGKLIREKTWKETIPRDHH